MGEARRRGTFEERKQNPKPKVEPIITGLDPLKRVFLLSTNPQFPGIEQDSRRRFYKVLESGQRIRISIPAADTELIRIDRRPNAKP